MAGKAVSVGAGEFPIRSRLDGRCNTVLGHTYGRSDGASAQVVTAIYRVLSTREYTVICYPYNFRPRPIVAKNPACTCTTPAPLVLAVLVVAASPGLLELTLVLGLDEVLVMVTMVDSLVITTCGFWAVPS